MRKEVVFLPRFVAGRLGIATLLREALRYKSLQKAPQTGIFREAQETQVPVVQELRTTGSRQLRRGRASAALRGREREANGGEAVEASVSARRGLPGT
jgi:hypothetical protein